MPDPRQHVRPGQKLQIAAQQINFLNGLMRKGGGFTSDGLSGWAPGSNVIMARNDTGAALPRHGVVQIGGFLVDPHAGESAESQFSAMPSVLAVLPECEGEESSAIPRVGVTVEPIAEDKCGRIVVSGVTPVRLNRYDASHRGARAVENEVGFMVSTNDYGAAASILWCAEQTGEQWALVTLAPPTGQVLMLGYLPTPASGPQTFVKGSIGNVQIYETSIALEEEPVEPTALVSCVNKLADVPYGRWVIVGYIGGRWYLVSAEC
jgi:hypothetical protein